MIRVVFLLWAAVAAVGAAPYSVTVIPLPSGFYNPGLVSINNAGQAAGNGSLLSSGSSQPFVASPSGSAVIPLPPGWTSGSAVGINNSGQVAGYGGNGTSGQAFIGTPSGSSVIPYPPGFVGPNASASASGLNDGGQVVGTVTGGGITPQPYIGTTAGSVTIPIPTGCSLGAYGFAVNSFGHVTGNCFPAGSPYIGTPSISNLVPSLSPSVGSEVGAFSINDSGQVAGGWLPVDVGYLASEAFLGTLGGITLIPLPAGATYVPIIVAGRTPLCLSNAGVVVGNSDAGPWIWTLTTGTQLINTQVPAGWNITGVFSISQNGRILAYGSFNGGAGQYVELVPGSLAPAATPAPSSVILAGLGLLLVVGCRVVRVLA